MKYLRYLYLLFAFLFIGYVSVPSPNFPKPPSDATQSLEEGDMEDTAVRRAYFTNFTRAEVLDYYQAQFSKSPLLGVPLLTYRLNYPPEDAQTIIRDQTRSTFLEEITHPFRESFFVNGFEPKAAKDDVWYKGVHYRQKIIVKYFRSSAYVRIIIAFLSLSAGVILFREIKYATCDLVRVLKERK